MGEMSDTQKGCLMIIVFPVIILLGVFNYLFVLLPLRLFVTVGKRFKRR